MDISPFTCMNGITCEAVYPRVSAEHDNIPIKNFYFDGTQKDLDTAVGIFWSWPAPTAAASSRSAASAYFPAGARRSRRRALYLRARNRNS